MTPDRIPRPERADDADAARRKVGVVLVERDDGTGRSGVGEFVEDDGRFFQRGFAAEDAFGDELVHGEVGLVQPEAFHIGGGEAVGGEVRGDVVGGHGADFLEHFAAFLHEQFVAVVARGGVAAVEEAAVVADVVGEDGGGLGAEYLPRALLFA